MQPLKTRGSSVSKNNLVEYIKQFEKAVNEFEASAQKGSEKHNRMVAKLDELGAQLSQYTTILSAPNTTSDQFLTALQNCAKLIQDAQASNEFKLYHVIAKTVPVLLYVLHGLDVMSNLFNFLIEKMIRMSKGNTISIFNNQNELSIGVFQSTNTHIFREIEKPNTDMQWFRQNVEEMENQAFLYDCQWQRKQ